MSTSRSSRTTSDQPRRGQVVGDAGPDDAAAHDDHLGPPGERGGHARSRSHSGRRRRPTVTATGDAAPRTAMSAPVGRPSLRALSHTSIADSGAATAASTACAGSAPIPSTLDAARAES